MAFRFKPPSIDNVTQTYLSYIIPKDKPFYKVTPIKIKDNVSYFISLTDLLHTWFLDNKVEYKIVYKSLKSSGARQYYIEIVDKSGAMLYKLTWA